MLNLIPNQEKHKIKKDFYFRLLIVFFLVMGVSFIIAAFSIAPYYLFSSQKKNFSMERLETQKRLPLPVFDAQTNKLVEDINLKLGLMENVNKTDKFVVSVKVINEIILKKMPDIKITSISYEDNVIKGKTLSVKGSAPSRDKLLLFRLALENDVNFEKVDLPISNFIKGTNIQFNLTLIPL
ncbi:MAG: hypothetical protein UU24_C0012G0017 [Candidatus Nomurabacteria bacterium GW2011_GWA2_40_9]|uniref:Uncharacterized protein n=1 Tax=Candidatus Nomurabacteria bacterium GW2011_GWA2_40_9 TaxID=1618734 RepID=A0A0G0WV77_9BACT|nr:MAG: hypothetical protein UU24_C0012G0017 [Candidatus Nomurabacteria bacterium GW2011_GWA2_40_9]